MPSERVIKDRCGATAAPNPKPLYVNNRIFDDPEAAAKHFMPDTNQRRDYYISLFHDLQYWSSKKTSGKSRVPEWQALCQSWNQFVPNFNNDPSGYCERIVSARERFIKFSKTSIIQRVHEGSVNANIPCAVPEGVHCPHCLAGAPRISERDLTGYTTNRVPANIKELRRFGETTYLEGEPIVSNEYENEPDLGSSSDWYGQQSDPPRGGSYRGQSYASVGGAGRSSHGQPRVDHSLQALHARVEALSTVQATERAEWRQLLLLQKACVADVARTASSIRIDVLEQVRLLQERVKRLEEKVRTLRASSSASHHD
ncbi:hypothetical protein PHMEG_00036321 [Phytophthora megakarya]|uniref:Uncharacterized protein n=1 Tax=Phytophthora megakarya TaxID=4795 RepID=A0A225UM98_9STRA|nr:hypothetical protein PHMEG_00036321 [Phytophthora megakarya]